MAISNFIPNVWSENLLGALDKSYVGVSHCNRAYEGDIRQVGSSVKICGVGAVTISDYTKDTDMDAPETLSDELCTLAINQAKCFHFQIDDVDRAQAMPSLMDAALKNAADALANTADTYVFSLYESAGNTITSASPSVENILGLLVDARTQLFASGVTNSDDIVIEVSPAVAALITKAKMLNCTDNSAVFERGCIGSMNGCKIFVSNNIAVDDDDVNHVKYHKCYVRSKRAIAFAEQLSQIDAYRPELRFADAMKGLHLFGAKVVYPEELVVLDLGFSYTPDDDDED